MNVHDIWHATLGELQLQMTRATFDTWVRATRGVAYADGIMTIGVPSPYAKEWLEGRLNSTIQRTLTGIIGKSVEVRYVTKGGAVAKPGAAADADPGEQTAAAAAEPKASETDDPQPGDVIVQLIDSPLVPYIQLQKYAIWFWQPLIGAPAFSLWIMLRTLDKENRARGPRHKLSVELIADTLGMGRQQITGRWRKETAGGKSEWEPGMFDVLNRERIAKIEAVGQGRNTIWWARVLNCLPLMTPQQTERLPDLLRGRHESFLKDFAVDAEKWEQIELPSLIND